MQAAAKAADRLKTPFTSTSKGMTCYASTQTTHSYDPASW